MKKLISTIAALSVAAIAATTAFAVEPGSVEDWGCDITNFFSADNTETVLTVVYHNSETDPTGWNIGFKVNHTDWEEANAVYPFYQCIDEPVDDNGNTTLIITRDELYSDIVSNFGGEIGEILWAEVRTSDTDAYIVSVDYSEETAEEPVASEPVADDTTADEPVADDTVVDTDAAVESDKASPDTGVEGVAAVAGLAALAAGALVISTKRK